MRRIVALLAFVSVLVALFAAPAAADTPAFPPVAPYEGCTDWYLGIGSPASPDEQQWAFTCEEGNFSPDDWSGWYRFDEYHWDADSSQVILFYTSYYEDGWSWYMYWYSCPSGCAYNA